MFTVVRTTTNLSLDEHFIKHSAATFFVKVEGDGMEDQGIYKGDTLIVDRSHNADKNSIVIVVIDGELPTQLMVVLYRDGKTQMPLSKRTVLVVRIQTRRCGARNHRPTIVEMC